MTVVADTTPLCHLAWIETDWVLPRLFGEVHAPERVMGELRAQGAPDSVRQWGANPPSWLKIHPDAPEENRLSTFEMIDAGEHAALVLALALQASLVVVDDRAARRVATELGLVTTGTLGVPPPLCGTYPNNGDVWFTAFASVDGTLALDVTHGSAANLMPTLSRCGRTELQ